MLRSVIKLVGTLPLNVVATVIIDGDTPKICL
jgi:hypothetical protein